MENKLKMLQKKELEMFIEVKKICEKYKLRYYAFGGTCLGAIRHQGFIPWDDDMDLAMPRKDYEIFKNIVSKELPPNLKIIEDASREIKHYDVMFLKVHDCTTTCIEGPYLDGYKGVYIDIMPFDGMPSGVVRQIHFLKLKLLKKLNTARRYPLKHYKTLSKKIIKVAVNPFIHLANFYYFSDKYSKLVQKYDFDDSEFCAPVCSMRMDKLILRKEDFNGYIEMPFENTKIRCPIGYKNYLYARFGNYMELPPIEERVLCHNFFYDLERPYTYYIDEKRKNKSMGVL